MTSVFYTYKTKYVFVTAQFGLIFSSQKQIFWTYLEDLELNQRRFKSFESGIQLKDSLGIDVQTSESWEGPIWIIREARGPMWMLLDVARAICKILMKNDQNCKTWSRDQNVKIWKLQGCDRGMQTTVHLWSNMAPVWNFGKIFLAVIQPRFAYYGTAWDLSLVYKF